MQKQADIIDCYNKAAANYAAQFGDELSRKHFDRMLLTAFASEQQHSGKIIDLGCGPGQTTKYLSDQGLKEITGTGLSPKMIKTAQSLYPALAFETADMLSLPYRDNTFGAAIAFYAIVHFDYSQVKTALEGIHGILKPGGHFLFSFHTGTEIIHLDEFLEQQVSIDFHFLEVSKVIALLEETGFSLIDCIERHPYPGVEHASKRAYLWVKAEK